MKRLFISFAVVLYFNVACAQTNLGLDHKQTMIVAKRLMKYYSQYENNVPESLKKARFNEYVDEVNPNLSLADRQKAFILVDAYINASRNKKLDIELTPEQQQELSRMLEESKQKKEVGMQAMLGKMQEIKNMSYIEYKNFVTQNGQLPLLESDIQKAYNQMHQNDGRKVEVSSKHVSIKVDNPVTALDIIQHPKKYKYQEFKMAMKYLKHDISDDEIKNIWNNKINK